MRTLSSRTEIVKVAVAFAVLTCVFTYPQILQMSSHVGGHYDALFSIWRLAWFAHQLWADPAHLFDANIFHPETSTLAYSDAIPFLGLTAAPFIWIGVKPVVAYNVLVLFSFVASGTAMYALARRLTGSAAAAFVAGSIFTFQQYRVAHFPQIELLWTCWIPLSFLALHDLIDRPRIRTGVLLGIAVSSQAWCSLYYAVYLVLALLFVAPIFLMARREWRIRDLLGPTAAAVAIAVVLCGPYAIPYIANRSAMANRAEKEAETWSPIIGNYLATSQTSVFYNAQPPRVGHIEGALFPGFAAAMLALCGVAARFGAIAVGYALLLIAAFDLSLGVNGLLHAPVTALVPPLQSLRVPARVFVIVSACISVLAAFAVARLRDWKPRAAAAIATFLAAIVFLEALATPIPLDALPSGPTLIYRWLASQPTTTIMEWPVPKASNLGHTRAPHQMFFSTLHWQRLINGYSGYYPDSFFEFLAHLDRFPDDLSLWYLQRRRVQYILLHSDTDPAAYRAALAFLRTHRDVEIMMRERVGEAEATLVRIRGV